ncbi:MAG: P44/Msp2 family outer membrane protein [Pseudanabaenaceae cyanobacterium bins.39]|nr:P44/Msp2 family outer membrane protein [Pseudanabaenaceae cyanobacterium bins.39]
MVYVGSRPAKFLGLAAIASSAIGIMGYSHGAQAGEVSAKQNEVSQSTAIAEAKIPTVSEYKAASNTSDKAADLKGTVSPTALTNLVADAPVAQASGTPAKAAVKSSEGFYASLSPLLFFGRNGGTVNGLVQNPVKSGIGVSGAVGYQFQDFRAEGELLYVKQDFDGSSVPTASVTGGYSTVALMANGYYDIPTGSGFKPYVGAGLGLAFISGDVGLKDNLGNVGSVSFSGSSFAYQLKAGATYAVTDNLDLGLGFRMFAQGNAKGSATGSVNGFTGSASGDAPLGTAFVAELTARLRF